jgi:hypothetical protein
LNQSCLRNKIIEENLTDDYTHVFWMDSDIVEYPNRGSFPNTGRNNRLYIALDTGLPWRWSTDSQSYALLISIIDAGEFE